MIAALLSALANSFLEKMAERAVDDIDTYCTEYSKQARDILPYKVCHQPTYFNGSSFAQLLHCCSWHRRLRRRSPRERRSTGRSSKRVGWSRPDQG